MSDKKRALIVTDGTELIQLIAQSIENALVDCDVKVCTAEKFGGTDLLPVQAFFLGCEKPAPASFAYLQEMLSHINLAGRHCGVFSTNKKTLKYLCGIVKDSDTGLGEPFLATDGKIHAPSVKKWLKKTLK